MHLNEVHVPAAPLDRYESVIGPERVGRLRSAYDALRQRFDGRTIWHVNSTATGGGVAEMLQVLLPYVRGAGIDARWLVIKGDAPFYAITKRIHNGLHGDPGDGQPLDEAAHRHYQTVTDANAEELLALVRPGDVVVLHDPQTAGLVGPMSRAGAAVVWRCHIGADEPNELVADRWGFLGDYLDDAHAFVFSRDAHVPAWARQRRVRIVAPSIDPFSAKNQPMDAPTVRAVLAHVGIVAADGSDTAPTFQREDGSPARIDHRADIIRTGPPPRPDAPLVVQISRWDRLKDMSGVLHGFAAHVGAATEAHLALVGPNVSGVTDDPEGAEVLQECYAAWRELPHAERARIQLVCLPMNDLEENAAIVNATQRHATVISQKSRAEGFGLTVTEGMWKARPVVASAIGGITDQIVDGSSGLLVADPSDLASFGDALNQVLDDPGFADSLGKAALDRVSERFLGDRHLLQWAELFIELEEAT